MVQATSATRSANASWQPTLNYRPNMLARYLKGQRLKAVGIMLPDIANPFSAELVEGMKEVLEPEGYTAFIASPARGIDHEREGCSPSSTIA